MLEALITRDTGEVIVVAPAGKAWGEFERTYFKVVEWEDAELGEVTDVIVRPYDVIGEVVVKAAEENDPAVIEEVVTGQSKLVNVKSIELSGVDILPIENVNVFEVEDA